MQSNAHKESLLRIELMEQPTVLSQLNTQLKKDQAARRELLMITLTSLQYLVRQGLPIRGHEEIEENLTSLLLLRAKYCPGLKQYRVLCQILTEIREAQIFSLIADEATDVAHKEQLCMTIRWVDRSFEIYETPVELINVPQTDSETPQLLKIL